MKKISNLILVFMGYSIFSMPAFSLPWAFLKTKNNSSNFTLFTINLITANGQPVKGQIAEADYVGWSVAAPCSDLKLLTSGSGEAELTPGYYAISADDFKEYPGAGYTCFKMNFSVKGKWYSTGNIQLTWSVANRNYIDANPKLVSLIFS